MGAAKAEQPEETAAERPSLAVALLAAQREVERVAKDARNKHHGYDYASAESMIAYGRPVLNRHGLVLLVSGHMYKAMHLEESTVDKDGTVTTSPLVAVVANIRLLHAHSGEVLEWKTDLMVIQSRGRPWDKGTLASETEILGYTIRDVLLIDRGDTETVSGRDDSDYQPGQRSKTRPRSGGGAKGDEGSKLDGLRVRVKELFRELGHLEPYSWDKAVRAIGRDPTTFGSGDAKGLVEIKEHLTSRIQAAMTDPADWMKTEEEKAQ